MPSYHHLHTFASVKTQQSSLGSHAQQSNDCYDTKTGLLIPITFQRIKPHFYEYQTPYQRAKTEKHTSMYPTGLNPMIFVPCNLAIFVANNERFQSANITASRWFTEKRSARHYQLEICASNSANIAKRYQDSFQCSFCCICFAMSQRLSATSLTSRSHTFWVLNCVAQPDIASLSEMTFVPRFMVWRAIKEQRMYAQAQTAPSVTNISIVK